MDAIVLRYLSVIWHETVRHRWSMGLAITAISFGFLGLGLLWKPQFETSITIYADNQNVIKPLLEGQAAVTVPKSERIRIVKEIMFAPRLLEQVVNFAFDDAKKFSDEVMEDKIAELRKNISLASPASDYVKVTYQNSDPDKSYRVVNKITNLFIEQSASAKRAESKNAYTFIDEQVKTYKSQLVEADNKLKAFETANVDGAEADVTAAISQLRHTIDEIEINIEAQKIRVKALENQLAQENRYAVRDYKAQVYRERLAKLQQQLDTLLLEYKEEHPDIIDLRMRIQDLKQTIVEVEKNNKDSGQLEGEQQFNPIYEELSNKLSAAQVDLKAMQHRLDANKSRLTEQYQRRARVANNQAALSELTRDYDVTKQIYEDLLARKEKARISMTLDLAGQGLTYKILEPAVYPKTPVGIRFVHFAAMGPIVGLILPLGAIVAFIFLDPKIRLAERLDETFSGIVLAVIPARESRPGTIRKAAVFAAGFACVYIGTTVFLHQVLAP